jgi:U32 family peptidase
MKQIEILSPAGSFESLVAAVNANCDAVYIGGNKFGARAFADNLESDMMIKAIEYAHIHDKKLYMTINTLLKNHELENELYEYLVKYYKHGLDAVIVQDVGVLHFIHEYFPDLPIHASTQMTLTMAQGAEVLKDKGITRLVNARELGLAEIKDIRNNTNLEIESFVHGALCFCYSGQCLMSSMFGGRSGNRGRCAQPCRMQYQLIENGKDITNQNEKFLLSPKDICTIDMIPDLIDAGIDSFKIEGRMKRPEYAAGVTYAYRKYVDLYLELGKEKYLRYLKDNSREFENDILVLQDLYNRGGFTEGYYKNRNGKTMMSMTRPNHSGVPIGEVKSVKNNQAQILLREIINPQDILEVRDGANNLYEFTVKNSEGKGKLYSFNYMKGTNVRVGSLVYRTKNNLILNDLNDRFLKEEKKEQLKGYLIAKVGEQLKLIITTKDISVEVLGDIVEEAKNQPMTNDKIQKQIMKTNESSYVFENLTIDIQGNVFIPVQKLNEIRRQGLDAITEAIINQYKREVKTDKENLRDEIKTNKENLSQVSIAVAVNTKEQLFAACNINEVNSIYIDSDIVPLEQLIDLTSTVFSRGKKCYIILPHIFRKATYELFARNKKVLEDNTINGFVLRNFEEYYFVTNEIDYMALNKELITDYNLYVMNRQASYFWSELGAYKHTAPVELNYSELKELTSLYSDIIVYGKLPLMVTAQCFSKTTSGEVNTNYSKSTDSPCCKANVKDIELKDRLQKVFQIKRHCRECYNTIYNSQCLSLLHNSSEIKSLQPDSIRLNFTFESENETTDVIHSFVQAYIYENKVEEIKDFTRGHFKRGIE